jgi:hypothetical protein
VTNSWALVNIQGLAIVAVWRSLTLYDTEAKSLIDIEPQVYRCTAVSKMKYTSHIQYMVRADKRSLLALLLGIGLRRLLHLRRAEADQRARRDWSKLVANNLARLAK